MNSGKYTEDEIFSILEPVEEHMEEADRKRLWMRISDDIRRRRPAGRILLRSAVAAASLAAVLILGIFIRNRHNEISAWEGMNFESLTASMPRGGGNITIAFPDKVVEVTASADVSYGDGVLTVVSDGETRTFELTGRDEIHQMAVPYGKRARLLLSDGTSISMNSGSRLIYRTEMRGKRREVYLNGEAFLDVARDESRPFTVKTDRLDVSVLGTSFNVKAYPYEEKQSVVLVSGKVSVLGDMLDHDYVIAPDQMFSYGSSNCDVSIDSVNPEDYICWKNDLLNLDSDSLKDVLMQLTRRYNIDFVYDNALRDVSMTGKLDLSDGPEAALESISLVSGIKYRKEGNSYIITMK